MYKLTLINSINEFETLREEWNSLLSKSAQDTFFLTWEWQFNWWRSFGGADALFIICLRDESGMLRGIAPLYIKVRAFLGLSVRRELRFIGTGCDATSEYLDFICSPGEEPELLKQFLGYIDSQRKGFDACVFEDINEFSVTAAAIESYLKDTAAFFLKEEERPFCPVIRLPGEWEEYVQSLPKLLRRNIRAGLRKLESSFRVEVNSYGSYDPQEKAFEHFKRLYGARRLKKKQKDKYLQKNYTDFQQHILEAVSRKQWLSLYLLSLDGVVAAAQYYFKYHGKLYFYQMGSDEHFKKFSLGQCLMSYVLKAAIGQGIYECDMLRGEEWYKLRMSNGARKKVRLVYTTGSFAGVLYLKLFKTRRLFFSVARKARKALKGTVVQKESVVIEE